MRPFPWRKTRDRYRVLVAEILLQQTNVQKVLPAYNEIVTRWPNPRALSQANQSALRTIIRPLGFGYRAKTLRKLAATLVHGYHARVPSAKEALLELPGVGEYIASAVLVLSTRQRHVLLDAPVARVLSRIFGFTPVLPDVHPSKEIQSVADKIVSRRHARRLNLALLDFGATICKLKKPRCSICPVQNHCNFYRCTSYFNGGE